MRNSKAMYALSYGLFVLSTRLGEKDSGCIINTGMQVTTEPNRVVFTVNKGNYTHDMLLESKRFTLSVLSEEADFSLFQRFGFQSGREVDKFAGLEKAVRGENEVLRPTQGVNAWISGWVVSTMDLGTHTLFLADVVDGDVISKAPSATYAYYQTHIKPRAQAPKEADGKKRWVCRVCGYIYEGETLPEDFICPICKHPASDFEEMKEN